MTYRHALIIGGTGMLLDAATSIARSARKSTFVARRAGSHCRLAQQLGEANGYQLLLLDWTEPGTFLDALQSHLNRLPAPDLVLGWFHDPGLASLLAARLEVRSQCKFVHVIGSGSKNPADLATWSAAKFTQLPQINYRQVLLGYVREGTASRWLTDTEICNGVLAAISLNAKRIIVGRIAEWERRP